MSRNETNQGLANWLASSIMDHWPFQKIDGRTITSLVEYPNGYDLYIEGGDVLEVRVSARVSKPKRRTP